jgi:F-type H+-transporting ATPase subunit c
MKKNVNLGGQMKGVKRIISALVVGSFYASTVLAEEVAVAATGGNEILATKGLAALAMAIAAVGAGGAQGKAISAALDSIGRNPGAAGAMFLPWILALALIESLAILTFVICIMVIS